MLRRILNRIAARIILFTVNEEDIEHELILDSDDQGDRNHFHVVPIDDLIEHETDLDSDCPCGPEVRPVKRDDGSIGWLYVHSALDGRDLEEDGRGVPLENPHGLLDEFDGLE